jgi:hypothetical protein
MLLLGIIFVLVLACLYVYFLCKNRKGSSVYNPFSRNDVYEFKHDGKGVGVGDEFAFMEGYKNEMKKGEKIGDDSGFHALNNRGN